MADFSASEVNTIITGDIREIAPKLATGSVHCIVCSPPYFGLRDYGTAEWEGGREDCDHSPRRENGAKSSTLNTPQNGHDHEPYRDICPKCGAIRKDKQIGLEESPEQYVETMVGIFRELKRILRDDGTVFLNLGDSYCSSSMDKSSRIKYNLREDLSKEEMYYVCMEMFGMWINQYEKTRKGALRKMLSPALHRKKNGRRSSISIKRKQTKLSKAQKRAIGEIETTKPTSEMGGNRKVRRKMRLLRGGNPGVFNGRSYQWRRIRTQKKLNREESIKFGDDLCRHSETRFPQGQISSSVYELQFLDRMLGILSTQTLKADEIPDSIRFAFAPRMNLKPKDLIGIPWRVALALQADGWWLRSDIIWAKKNPMPESVRDRPTKAHEYIFLLSKKARYYYDQEAAREPFADDRMGNPGTNGTRQYYVDLAWQRIAEAKPKPPYEQKEMTYG